MWPRWWLIASVAAHAVVLGAMIESSMSWHHFWASLGGAPPGVVRPGTMPRQLVLFVPGTPAPPPRVRGTGEGYFRVALTVDEERLAEAAERMGRVLARA